MHTFVLYYPCHRKTTFFSQKNKFIRLIFRDFRDFY